MRKRLGFATAAVMIAALGLPSPVHGQAQDLAAAAEREKERRKKTSGKAATYSDKNLPASSSPQATAAPSASPSPAAGETREAPKDEAYWRGRATGLQNAVTAAEARVAKAQEDYDGARKGNVQPLPIDALSQVPPLPQVNAEADRLQKELEAAQAALAQAKKALEDFEEEARKAGVPPGWLR